MFTPLSAGARQGDRSVRHGAVRRAPIAIVALAAGCLALAAACGPGSRPSADESSTASQGPARSAAEGAVVVTDDGGRLVRLDRPARRVISLIPSVNETLVAIGATDRIVGRTRYDVAPELAGLPSVGGGIDPSVEAVLALSPDLVLGWEHDKRRGAIARLAALSVPVFTLRTQDTADTFRGIANLGRLTGRELAAAALAAHLRGEFVTIRRSVADRPQPSVMYVVFDDPATTAGAGSFIGELIGVAGGRPLFDDLEQLWPTVSLEEVVQRDPDIVVLPVDGDGAAAVAALRRRAGWRDVRAVRDGRVATVPTNLVSRPGPNLDAAARALRDAFHPDLAGHEPAVAASRQPPSATARP